MAPRTPLADLTALVLDVGQPVWVCGPTAAALWGFDGFRLRPPYHLALPRDRNVRRIGVHVHTTIDLPPIDRTSISGLPVVRPHRVVIELARSEPPDVLAAAIDSGLRDGRFNEQLLHRRIVALRGRGRYGLQRLLDVLAGHEVTRGGHSWLERRFLTLMASAGLPRPTTQQVLTKAQDKLVRVDFAFAGTNVVVEVLGYQFHRSQQQMNRDAARINALLLAGQAPYQFTYRQIVETPDRVTADVIAALNLALSRSA
jgi:hypothetical protein